MHYYTMIDSPIDPLLLVGDGEQLTGLYMDAEVNFEKIAAEGKEDAKVFRTAIEQLRAYFAGELRHFDLPTRAQGTAFQQRVWQALSEIPYGVTVSYKHIAERIGAPKAVRAVGLANGQNPISIIVPCHRVIGANGKLTGYGGGLPRKQWLLGHEASQGVLGI